MTCKEQPKFYDLQLLEKVSLPINNIIRPESSKYMNTIVQTREKNRLWDMFYNIKPNLVNTFKQSAIVHIKYIRDDIKYYGYLYFIF